MLFFSLKSTKNEQRCVLTSKKLDLYTLEGYSMGIKKEKGREGSENPGWAENVERKGRYWTPINVWKLE